MTVTFEYGAMSSGKTLRLISLVLLCNLQQKKTLCIKPSIDSRYDSEDQIVSKSGHRITANYVIDRDFEFDSEDVEGIEQVKSIFVDEAQFLSRSNIDSIIKLSQTHKIPVFFFGLKLDFKGEMFEGSRKLFEVCDKLYELTSPCYYCMENAAYHLRFCGNTPVFDGAQILLGDSDIYRSVCRNCYNKELEQSTKNNAFKKTG